MCPARVFTGPWGRRAMVGSRTACLGDAGWEPLPCCRASPTHPLLPVTVLKVIDGAVIPVQPDAHQVARQETIFCQDHKVGEEAPKSLDHSCEEERGETGRGSGGLPASLRHLWGLSRPPPPGGGCAPSVVLPNSIWGWALRGPSGGECLRGVTWDRSLGERAPQMNNLVAPSQLMRPPDHQDIPEDTWAGVLTICRNDLPRLLATTGKPLLPGTSE